MEHATAPGEAAMPFGEHRMIKDVAATVVLVHHIHPLDLHLGANPRGVIMQCFAPGAPNILIMSIL